MRKYIFKNRKESLDPSGIKELIKDVFKNKLAFREAQEGYQTPKSTIFKIILKRKKETPTQGQIYNIRSSGYDYKATCRMVFTEEQERQHLSDHINTLHSITIVN